MTINAATNSQSRQTGRVPCCIRSTRCQQHRESECAYEDYVPNRSPRATWTAPSHTRRNHRPTARLVCDLHASRIVISGIQFLWPFRLDSGMGTFRPWRKQPSRALLAWAVRDLFKRTRNPHLSVARFPAKLGCRLLLIFRFGKVVPCVCSSSRS